MAEASVERVYSLDWWPFRVPVKDASRGVAFRFADFDNFRSRRQLLREAGRFSAHRADRGEHHDAVGDSEECGARTWEGITGEGLVQDDENDASPGLTKPSDEAYKLSVVEELRLIDSDDFDVVGDELSHLSDGANWIRHESAAAVARDLHRIVASRIVGVLEHDQLLPGVLRAAQTADEFLGFSAEHASSDDVDRTEAVKGAGRRVHECAPW